MQALIQTSTPDTATGEIQKGYEIFNKRGVEMPDPMRLMSASPGYFSIMLQRNIYYANHPNLSFSLLAHIRYLHPADWITASAGYSIKRCWLKWGCQKKTLQP